ncbi:hypothetical protein BKK80_34790 (plasmid) [Cupriavidus malaysiensis]|uniref:Transposase n=1 Tax=Cupriavidus malaysiensis TaxID=367825 RepID=A0ABM6FGQ4_9BURK|nr:hypothetical protein BKK80_34790 [Cupriavidus malaysiensis]
MESVYKAVYELDCTLASHVYALELLQPSTAGKTSVRFLKRSRGDGSGRHPQFVQWYKSKGGKLLYKRLKRQDVLRQVKTFGPFGGVEDDVKAMVREIQRMMEIRENLLRVVDNLRQKAKLIVGISEKTRMAKDARVTLIVPALVARRAEMQRAHRAQLRAADEALPVDATETLGTRPGISRVGRTRGKLHPTTKGRRARTQPTKA